MPPEHGVKSPLETARERLYAPQGASTFTVPTLRSEQPAPVTGWTPPPTPPPHKGLPLSSLFLIIAGIFFVVALGVAAFLVLTGGRSVSTDNIEISVAGGSTTIGSGDTVNLLIHVQNANPVAISSTELSIDFPEGTRSPDDVTAALSHYGDTLGDIAPSAGADRTVRAVFFGAEGQKFRLPIRLEYRTEGSNTSFIKEFVYEFTITTSPLSVTVGSLSQVSAGQSFTVAVAVRSNATAPIPNTGLQIDYPPGFIPSTTSPKPLAGTFFDLGTMLPGEEKVVSVTGTLSGEDRDIRVFRFTTGTRLKPEDTTLTTTYTTASSPVALERPFLAPTLTLNRDTTGALILATGQQVDGMLSWINTLDAPIQDAQVAVSLSGNGLDAASVRTANGFYRSGTGTVVFSKETLPALAQVAPGETGNGAFAFSTKSGAALSGVRNPTILVSVSVSGRRLDERNVSGNVAATITRTLKVGTDLALSARAVRSTGAFTNTGPWPPVVDKETTYTIEWSLSNTVNSVANGKVIAVLPSYVKYTGAQSPADGSITWNETARTLTWNAGEIPPGTAAKKVSFQIALTPSETQRNTSPTLSTSQIVSGVDRFTEGKLEGSAPDLSTTIIHDPAWSPSAGQVQ